LPTAGEYSGDLVKAIAAGGSSIVIGSFFAGTEKSSGEMIIFEGRKFKSYRGMGSLETMESGSKDKYFQDAEERMSKRSEGIVGRVPFKGLKKKKVSEVLYQLVGGTFRLEWVCGTKHRRPSEDGKFVKIWQRE
jgi:IMP dehydrogenase